MSVFNLDPTFNQKLKEGFKLAVGQVEEQTRREITSKKWSYPRETKRANGTTVSTPRDIVDSGALRDSLSSQMRGEMQAEIGTNVDYSLLVHDGYTTSAGNDVPARPYLVTGFTESDRLGLIQEAFNVAINK